MANPSEFAARRVREIRRERGWTARDLAQQCAEIGAPQMTHQVIANIEAGRPGPDGRRRRDLSVDEWLALAYALNVAPVDLLGAVSGEESIAITSDTEVPAANVAAWITGRQPSPVPAGLLTDWAYCGSCDHALRIRCCEDASGLPFQVYSCPNRSCPRPVTRRTDLVDMYVVRIVSGIVREATGEPSSLEELTTLSRAALHRLLRTVLSRVVLLPVDQPETEPDATSVLLEWVWEAESAQAGD